MVCPQAISELTYHYHHLQHQDILVVQYETNRTKHFRTKLLIVNINRKMSDADASNPQKTDLHSTGTIPGIRNLVSLLHIVHRLWTSSMDIGLLDTIRF